MDAAHLSLGLHEPARGGGGVRGGVRAACWGRDQAEEDQQRQDQRGKRKAKGYGGRWLQGGNLPATLRL